jgi:hypothetical protein
MKPVSPVLPHRPEFADDEIVLGKDQQIMNLPALCESIRGANIAMVRNIFDANYVMTRWELTDEDIQRIQETRSIYFETWKNFNEAFQPIRLSTIAPDQPDPDFADAVQEVGSEKLQ